LANTTIRNGLIRNDGALKAVFTQFPRLEGLFSQRIRFLWTALPVRTSGNPAVKRRPRTKTLVLP